MLPTLTQFRVEITDRNLAHLIFDCPDRTMNVFSNAAIHELGTFADWLKTADVRGLVVRSGKTNAFCAGADLTELGVAYDMIMAAPEADRFDIAYNHFFPLSHAIRRLETAGKPVAAAIAGVALGGGCELTLGCHYRVAVESPGVMLGLPESGVGLLPGAGGTQRMPRLVGLELGLEVLLRGMTLSGQAAVDAGLVDELVETGEEIAAAERWLLSDAAHSIQPWDRPEYTPASHSDAAATIAAYREAELARMLGHEPAPLAILDCVELGHMQYMDGAIRSEMAIFARLIQRAEARNMIQTLFLGKQDYDRAKRKDAIPAAVTDAITTLSPIIESARADHPALADAGFGGGSTAVQNRIGLGYWLDTGAGAAAHAALQPIAVTARNLSASLTPDEQRMADYALYKSTGFPAYLGGPFAYGKSRQYA